MKLAIFIKILDIIHDVLCPFFKDKEDKTDKK
jgi:hypothetical protein